jgi:hypothetical protein
MILFFQSYLTLLLKKKLFALKFSPRAGVSRYPAIYMINHNNDIFVQLKREESLGKLISLVARGEPRLDSTKAGGARE